MRDDGMTLDEFSDQLRLRLLVEVPPQETPGEDPEE